MATNNHASENIPLVENFLSLSTKFLSFETPLISFWFLHFLQDFFTVQNRFESEAVLLAGHIQKFLQADPAFWNSDCLRTIPDQTKKKACLCAS